jgi:hypothetical protein
MVWTRDRGRKHSLSSDDHRPPFIVASRRQSNFLLPLYASDEDFNSALDTLERLFVAGKAAIVVRSTSSSVEYMREISIFDNDESEISDRDREIIRWLDAFLFFGINRAPAPIVQRFLAPEILTLSKAEVDELKEKATRRLATLYDRLPNVRRQWRAKNDSLLPGLTSFEIRPVREADDAEGAVIVRVAAALGDAYGFDPDSSQQVTVKLFRSDVRYLISELEMAVLAIEEENSIVEE